MVLNSSFGNRDIIRAMLDNEKAEFLATPLQRWLLGSFGHIILGLIGWPVDIKARQRAGIIFNYLKDINGRVLDVGCAFGVHAFELNRKLGCQVTGIDINEHNLKLARRIQTVLGAEKVSFHYADILNANFSDEEFDAVLISQVIEHIRNDNGLIKEINRILKNDGVLVLSTDYAETSEDYKSPRLTSGNKADKDIPGDLFIGGGHWRSGYNQEKLNSLMENNGFKILNTSFVKIPSILPKSVMLFPLIYPLCLALRPLSSKKEDIIVKAKKVA